MRISQQQNVHIICVIHQNFGSAKLGTGHLGSCIREKSRNSNKFGSKHSKQRLDNGKCGRSRGYSFETFSFEVNEKGLPIIVGDLYDPLK